MSEQVRAELYGGSRDGYEFVVSGSLDAVGAVSYIAVSAELFADRIDLAPLLYGRPWTAEERETARRLRVEQALAQMRWAAARHAAVRRQVDGRLREVLEHHGPHMDGSSGSRVTCSGCDAGGHAEEDPDWPCSTWTLISGE